VKIIEPGFGASVGRDYAQLEFETTEFPWVK